MGFTDNTMQDRTPCADGSVTRTLAAIRDSIVNLLLPVGYTPPRNPVANARTKKQKARRARQKERLRILEGRSLNPGTQSDAHGRPVSEPQETKP